MIMGNCEYTIKKAQEIKAAKQADFENLMRIFADDYPAQKVVSFVQEIDKAGFWIDNQKITAYQLVRECFTIGLDVSGLLGSDCIIAKADRVTGNITISWDEYIPDGSGGQYVPQSRVV